MRALLRGGYEALRRRLNPEDKVLIKNSSWIFSSNLFVAVLTFAKSVVVARGLGAELFGTFVVMAAVAITVNEFFDMNLGTSIIKYGSVYMAEGRIDKLVAITKAGGLACLGLGAVSMLVMYGVVAFAYDTFVTTEGYESLLLLYGLVSITAYFDSISIGLLRLFYKFKVNAAVRVAAAVLDTLLSALVLLLFPHQLRPFFIAMIALKGLSSLVLNVAAGAELYRFMRPHLGVRLSVLRGEWRGIAGFTLSASGSSTVNRLRSQGDKLLLGAVAGVQQVAYYEIARKLSTSCLRLTDPLRLTIYPQLANLVASARYREVVGLVKRVSILFAIPGLVIVAGGVVFGHAAVATLYGAEFVAAVSPLVVYLFVVAIDLSMFWVSSLMNSVGKARELFWIDLATLVALVPIAYGAAVYWGAAGMALAMLVTKVGSTAAQLRICARSLRPSLTSEAAAPEDVTKPVGA